MNQRPTNLPKGYVFTNFTKQCNAKCASNRAAWPLHLKMDDDHTGPLGSANHSGSSHRTYESPSPAFLTRNAPPISITTEGVRSGNGGAIIKAGYSSSSSSFPPKRGIYKFYVHSPQKGWGKSPSYKFKAPKSISSLRTFQNGGNPHVARSFETRRLPCKDRSQGCIPNCSNLEESPEISTISMEGNTTRICLPPIWVSHSTQGIHKTNETSSSCPKTSGYSPSDILGRHTNHGRMTSLGITPCSIHLEPPGGPRFYSQLQKIPVSPVPKNRVFRFSNRFNQSNPPTPRGETLQNSKNMSKAFRKNRNFGSGIIKIPGPPNILHSSHFPSPPPLQASSTAEKHYHDLTSVIRGPTDIRHSSQRRSSVVERPSPRVEWQSAIPTSHRYSNIPST